jgi:hypothetical protein
MTRFFTFADKKRQVLTWKQVKSGKEGEKTPIFRLARPLR